MQPSLHPTLPLTTTRLSSTAFSRTASVSESSTSYAEHGYVSDAAATGASSRRHWPARDMDSLPSIHQQLLPGCYLTWPPCLESAPPTLLIGSHGYPCFRERLTASFATLLRKDAMG